VPPLGGFVVAVLVAHLLGLAAQRGWMRHTAFASLIVEIAFLGLAASGLVGASSAWLIPGITFVATLQTLSFTHLEALSYTSVMTTGNLRRAAQKLFVGLIPRYDAGALHDSALLATISFCFSAAPCAVDSSRGSRPMSRCGRGVAARRRVRGDRAAGAAAGGDPAGGAGGDGGNGSDGGNATSATNATNATNAAAPESEYVTSQRA
jgi:hypothetical protein